MDFEIIDKDNSINIEDSILKLILSQVHSGIVIVDKNRKIKYSNDHIKNVISLEPKNLNELFDCIDNDDKILSKSVNNLFNSNDYNMPINTVNCIKKGIFDKYINVNISKFNFNNEDYLIIIIDDITKVKNIEEINFKNKKFLNSIIDYANMIICIWGNDSNLITFNKFGQKLTRFSIEEVLEKKWIGKLFDLRHIPLIREYFCKLKKEEIIETYEIPIKCSDGNIIDVLWNTSLLFDKKNDIEYIISMGIDITERKNIENRLSKQNVEIAAAQVELRAQYQELEAMHEQLAAAEEELRAQYEELQESQETLRKSEEKYKNLAYYDQLTELPNRTLLYYKLTTALNEAHKKNNKVALLFMDLDNFKSINDTLGHGYGDIVLKRTSELLKSIMPYNSILSRLAGDEFVILLDNIKDDIQINNVMNKILELFQQPLIISNQEIYLTTSLGVAIYPKDGTDEETLLRNADIAMYYAKEKGKNNCQLYRRELNEKLSKKLKLEGSIRNALKNKEFTLYYQPLINIETGKIEEVEALIRWFKPGYGFIGPAEFIPVAEETGLIVPIGEYVIREACAQNMKWQKKGFEPIKISVNLSAKQFMGNNLIETLNKTLKETKINSNLVTLEITESLAMNDLDLTVNTLSILRNNGMKISLDDFGTGYSSLYYLKNLPIDNLKIDKSFIKNIATDESERSIVEAVIHLAHSLNMKVIAEGVETNEQLKVLKESGCDKVQGYLFSKPIPPEKLQDLLKANIFKSIFY